jgi:hypothetical protein
VLYYGFCYLHEKGEEMAAAGEKEEEVWLLLYACNGVKEYC